MVGYYFLIRRKPYSNFKRLGLVISLIVVIAGASLVGQRVVEIVPQMQGIASKVDSRFSKWDNVVKAGTFINCLGNWARF